MRIQPSVGEYVMATDRTRAGSGTQPLMSAGGPADRLASTALVLGSDSVSLSKEVTVQTSTQRQAKLQSLSNAISMGTYHVSVDALAEAMINKGAVILSDE